MDSVGLTDFCYPGGGCFYNIMVGSEILIKVIYVEEKAKN